MLSFWKAPVWIVAGITLFDQLTKALVNANWEIGSEHTVIPGFFYLVHYRNSGAAWGMLRDHPEFLGLLSIAALLFLVLRFRQLVSGSRFRGLALSLVGGGIAGNLIDRVVLKEVVDFLLFDLQLFRWPAFNVADSAICVGVGAFVLSSFLYPEELPADEAPADGPTAAGSES